ncbi:MAG TPA: type II toxin-antitoxin system Phd/YefM family antitoxin [Myxococcaceae bacterium]|nr:type II toxin-antitoxin system Phd/YefM family antitoxin [Myxococcaceae bacterium]
MKLTEDIKPVTYMKTRAAELLREVKRSRRPVVITQHGEAQAVVLDVATYEALRDATLLLQLTAQGEADVQAGRTLPQAQAFARARKRLAQRERQE